MAVIVESPEIIARNIKDWNIPVPDKKYKVVVHCSTYNHSKYIEDALKGFVMQETNFPFCAIVIDDGSTDNNAEIIRRYAAQYPDIIKPICLGYDHMQHGLSRNPYFDCWHEACEYLAQCEGDDYWTDPKKLQKQVDWMDEHEECGFCYTRAKVYNQTEERFIGVLGKDQKFEDLLFVDYIPTCTVLIRASAQRVYSEKVQVDKSWKMGDYPLFLYLSYKFGNKFIDDITGVYRELEHSASHSSDLSKQVSFYYSAHRCRMHFAKFSQNNELEAKIYYSSMNSILNHVILHDVKFEKYLYDEIFGSKFSTASLKVLCVMSMSRIGRKLMRVKYKLAEKIYTLYNR